MSLFKDYEQERRERVFNETVEKVDLILQHLDLRYVPKDYKHSSLERGAEQGFVLSSANVGRVLADLKEARPTP